MLKKAEVTNQLDQKIVSLSVVGVVSVAWIASQALPGHVGIIGATILAALPFSFLAKKKNYAYLSKAVMATSVVVGIGMMLVSQ